MKLTYPLRFEIGLPFQLAPLRFSLPLADTSPARKSTTVDSSAEFNQRLARYKRAGLEWSQIWLRTHQHHLYNYIPPMLAHLIIDPFESTDWQIEDWHIKFMLSERLLTHARKQSARPNWYEDSQIATTWNELIGVCFHSVQRYHRTFHSLPVVGDRLFNEDTGWRIQDRAIDGDLMTITFTLDS